MALGRNTTLSYIVACIEKKFQVFVHQIPDKGRIISSYISAIYLDLENAKNLVIKFKEENLKLKNLIDKNSDLKDFLQIPAVKVEEIEDINFVHKSIETSKINFVIQRLEPMKAPFPPQGKIKIDDVLREIKNLFPNYFVFNCPIAKEDKGLPLMLDADFESSINNLAIPTVESYIGDNNFIQKVNKIAKSSCGKIVLKPDNSAQVYGVFSVKFNNLGQNLEEIKQQTVGCLLQMQIYNLKNNLPDEELKQILEILFYIQFCLAKKSNNVQQKITNITPNIILQGAKYLYNNKILIQPFLDDIKFGDIRVNLAKDRNGQFTVIGCTFRRAVFNESTNNFTTSLTAGQSVLQPIESLLNINILGRENGQETMKDLINKVNFITNKLNQDPLKSKYKHSTELGCDFILSGNKKTILLGEVNHHCQAVIPQAEAMIEYVQKSDFYRQVNAKLINKYDGGINIVSNVIDEQILLQDSGR
jgi:hypothetical protein